MKNINKLSGLVLLLGLGVLGAVWFKRNKPKTASEQLAELKAKSASLSTGGDTIDKPFVYSQDIVKNTGVNPYSKSTVTIGDFTPAEITAIKTVVDFMPDYGQNVSNQLAESMKNLDFSDLSSLGLSNIDLSKMDFSNIKIK